MVSIITSSATSFPSSVAAARLFGKEQGQFNSGDGNHPAHALRMRTVLIRRLSTWFDSTVLDQIYCGENGIHAGLISQPQSVRLRPPQPFWGCRIARLHSVCTRGTGVGLSASPPFRRCSSCATSAPLKTERFRLNSERRHQAAREYRFESCPLITVSWRKASRERSSNGRTLAQVYVGRRSVGDCLAVNQAV